MNGKNGQIEGHAFDVATLEEFDLDRLRQQAVAAGVDISQIGHQRQITERRQRATELAHTRRESRAAQWHETARQWAAALGDALVLFVTLFAKYLMPPIGIAGLWWVEIARTKTGIALFDPGRAGLMSTVLLSVYLSLLIVRADTAAKLGETSRYRWSLRSVFNSAAYLAGLRRLEQRTQLQSIDNVIRALVVLIVLLGTAGTMAEEMALWDGAWYHALADMATGADLLTMMTLISGALVSYLLLLALHYVVQMTYSQYAQIMPEDALSADFFDAHSDAQQAANRAEALYLMAAIQKQRGKKRGR